MSTAVLFGAGASAGSDTHGTPPLGNDLFDELSNFDPKGWGAIDKNLSAEFCEDFEQAFAKVDELDISQLQRKMAAFFFEFKPTRMNLYHQLARRIAASSVWDGVLCTLNYDRLLELSLEAANLSLIMGGPPKSANKIELCFPHGCCNLFNVSVHGDAGSVTFGQNVQTTGDVRAIDDPIEHRNRIHSDAFPPVMSYFEPQKHTTSGADFINCQRRRWAEVSVSASKIIILGVGVRSHDSHIWDPIAKSPAQVIYCGGQKGADEFCSWASDVRSEADDKILKGFFCDEYENLCKELGI